LINNVARSVLLATLIFIHLWAVALLLEALPQNFIHPVNGVEIAQLFPNEDIMSVFGPG
jgi:hypothetical protein